VLAGAHRPEIPTSDVETGQSTGDLFTFADGAPILVVSEASVATLNDRIVAAAVPCPMALRPNLVVDGCAAFAEDTWSSLQSATSSCAAPASPNGA